MSPPMRRLMRVTRGIAIALGGTFSLVGTMALVGLVTESFWVRLLVALVVLVGLPAALSDRILKWSDGTTSRLSIVADTFAIVWLLGALALVATGASTRSIVVREGDRYARSGSQTTARLVYFVAGVSPTFPDANAQALAGATSASASASGAASASDGGSGR